MPKYAGRRPSKKVLVDVMDWMAAHGLQIYTGCADLDTGQRNFGCMDIDTVDDVIKVYELDRADAWIDPEY